MRGIRKGSVRACSAFVPALVIALSAALLVPAAAGAATYLLRPANTTSLQSGWSVTPSTSTADAVLNKPVTQPALPDTSSYLTAGSGSANYYAGVGVSPAPAFRTGETLKSTTAWAYLSTAASQPLVMSLWNWWWQLGATTIPAGSPAGWYSLAPHSQLDTTQLQNLAVAFQPSGTGAGSRVYAAYVEVDTNDPPPTTSTSTPSVSTSSTSPSVPTNPVPPPVTTGTFTNLVTQVALAAQVVKLAPGAKSVDLEVSCAPGTPHGCTGEIVLSLPSAPVAKHASTGRPRAVLARCARGCRALGHSNFTIAAGRTKKVKVRLAHSASRLFHGRHSIDLLATTTTHDGTGHTQTSTATVTVDRAGPGPKPGAGPGSRPHRPPSQGRPPGGSQSHPQSRPQGGSQPSSGSKNNNSPKAPAQGSAGKGNSSGPHNPGSSHGRRRHR